MTDIPEFPVHVEVNSTIPNAGKEPWYAEPQEPLANIEDVVLVASGKGGVGKSTVTVNLACALAKSGKRVGLLDADLYGPSITRMMGTGIDLPVNNEGYTMPVQNHGVWTVSVGNVMPPEAALVWKGPLVAQTLMQMFRDIAWPELDILLVDLPPGTGDVPLTIVEQIPITGCVLVTTPQKLSVVDASRGIAMFHDLDIPVFGIVENMNQYICPCCGEVQALFPDGAAAMLAEQKHVTFLGGIPLDPEGQQLADSGKPLVIARPLSPAAQAFVELAGEVDRAIVKERAFRQRDADPKARADHESFWENLLDE